MAANLNVLVDEYTNRVLGVIKEKFGLKDKGEALNKFAHMYGSEYVDAEVREEVVRSILHMDEEYFAKNPKGKAMSLDQLDKLTSA